MTEPEIPLRPDEHLRGDPTAPVTLIEYADVECPSCAAAEPLLRRLLAERPVRLAYRHFPLVEVHRHAFSAALALEAAAAAERFWPLHDLLLERQDALGRRHLAAYAVELGLDPAVVLRPASEAYDARVRSDVASGVALGVSGTPGVLVQGRLLAGGVTWARLLAAVDGVLAGE